MSTFDGIVKEFPDIRIDFFRQSSEQSRPPLAYFLSHVHSDHLTGLESCKSPFIYCSPATREILLGLEKYPHRMNFAKGILESRQQTYRHLKNLLKPIPLESPSVIELSPGNTIRVTLFDANHCVGAVCFLVEGNGKAILYTGDVRSEAWWVSSLCRQPLVLPYVPSTGTLRAPLKQLDCLYLDTTFAHKDDPYKGFPSKAEGLTELLLAVSKYPKSTKFYFDSWTFGYEDVWQALSAHLSSQIHVDEYRYGLYRALANGSDPKAPESAKLMGFHCGNHFQEGCLTSASARIHSCEKGTGCEILDQDYVRITPIISRHNGLDMAELGAGGGQGDLDTRHELEVGDAGLVGQLIGLCASKLHSQPQLLASIMELLTSFINRRVSAVSLDGSGLIDDCARLAGEEGFDNIDDLPLERLVPALAKLVTRQKQSKGIQVPRCPQPSSARPDGLPKRITFPFSRHSSYSELCGLVDALQPKDVHPCTVDDANWTMANSMSFLFGHVYGNSTVPTFSHDQLMLAKRGVVGGGSLLRSRPSPSDSDHEQRYDAQKTQRHREDERRNADKRNRRSPSDVPTPDAEAMNALQRAARPFDGSAAAPGRTRPPRPSPADGQNAAQWLEQSVQRSKRRRRSPHESSAGRLSLPSPEAPQPQPPALMDSHTAAMRSAAEGKRLFIGNLVSGATEADLRALFAGYAVENVYIPSHLGGTDEAAYGFVDLATSSEAQHAISALRSATLSGHFVRVQFARPSGTPRTLQGEIEPPSRDDVRLALRREAHEAAMNTDGVHWSRVGLVSTNCSHQIKEEEL